MSPDCFRYRLLCRLLMLGGVLFLTLPRSGHAADRRSQSAEETVHVDAAAVVEYVRGCRKPNGAFGPREQEYTDAAWNYPAVHTLVLLGEPFGSREAILQNGLGYPTGHAGYGHWLIYHQAMIRWLLRGPEETGSRGAAATVELEYQGDEIRYYGSPFATKGEALFQTSGETAAAGFGTAETLGYYNLSSLYYTVAAVIASGRTVDGADALVKFIRERQAPGGGFVDVRSSGTAPKDADAHLAHTCQAVATLRLLGEEIPNRRDIIAFARSCQDTGDDDGEEVTGEGTPAGGFRFHPDRTKAGNFADVYYTCCGLQILHQLDAAPTDPAGCLKWLNRLQNVDGGFGDRPGWRSRLYSTYYAVHSLTLLAELQAGDTPAETSGAGTPSSDAAVDKREAALRELCGLDRNRTAAALISSKWRFVKKAREIADPELRIFQGLFKTPVVAAADLAGLHDRGFDQIAMKTDDFAVAAPLLKAVQEQGLPLSVLLCPEAYPHRLQRYGGAELHHVGNFTLDPKWNADQRRVWQQADTDGQRGLSWDDYRRKVLAPLQELGSLCYPEQDFEMEYAYSAYDAGVAGQHGYNAVQVGFNWSPRDFVRVFPWRERYTDKLPPVADADAHGDLKKWSPQLDHVRHLYLAREPGYAGFLAAARRGHVVCVIAEPEGVSSGVSLYGSPAVVRYVRERIDQWRWWLEGRRD